MYIISYQTEGSGSYKPAHFKDVIYLKVQMGGPETNTEMPLWRSVFLQNSHTEILILKMTV